MTVPNLDGVLAEMMKAAADFKAEDKAKAKARRKREKAAVKPKAKPANIDLAALRAQQKARGREG